MVQQIPQEELEATIKRGWANKRGYVVGVTRELMSARKTLAAAAQHVPQTEAAKPFWEALSDHIARFPPSVPPTEGSGGGDAA